MLTRARVAILALAGLTLAACGSVHPGSAAVVDGKDISIKTLDSTAAAYCTLTAESARQQGVTSVSNAQVRRQAVVGLVSLVVARRLAASEDIKVDPSTYELTATQRDQLAKQFPSADVDDLGQAIEDSQEISAIAVALAVKQTGQEATPDNEEQLADAGQAAIIAAFPDNDVSFAPRFGLSPTGKMRADTGSVSVSPVDLEAPVDEELPQALRCS
jgi:hypothetical protein